MLDNVTLISINADNNTTKETKENKTKIKETLFDEFWVSYHLHTQKPKSDKEAALKYWMRLSNEETKKAINSIELYVKSLSALKYAKKARTYLSDKNFNDEFSVKPTRQSITL